LRNVEQPLSNFFASGVLNLRCLLPGGRSLDEGPYAPRDRRARPLRHAIEIRHESFRRTQGGFRASSDFQPARILLLREADPDGARVAVLRDRGK